MKFEQVRTLNRLDREGKMQADEIIRLQLLINEIEGRVEKLEQKPKRGRSAKNAKTN